MKYKKEEPKIKILVACHKADPNIRQDGIYMPIQVGKALHPEIDLGFQCDNTGDNISEKNGSYCELTALYWAWKNLKDVDYIGLAHYRRYFDMSPKQVLDAYNKDSIIIANHRILPISVYDELVHWTSLEDTTIFIDTIMTLYPDYSEDILSYYFRGNKFSQFNMMLMSKENYNLYCEFIFSVLIKTEQRIRLASYTRQRRVIGYLAESLLGLWIKHNKIKPCIVATTVDMHNNKLKRMLNKIRFDFAFLLSRQFTDTNKGIITQPLKVGLEADGIICKQIKYK